MSVYTLLLYFTYFILLILTIILITAITPLKIRSETNVDGVYFIELFEFKILLGFLAGKVYLETTGGKFQLKIASIQVYATKWINKQKEKKEEEKEEKVSRKRGNFRGLIKPGKRLLTSLLGRVMLQLDLDLEAGLSDPYVCGLIFGFIYPLVQIIEMYCQMCSVSVTPFFIEEKFKGRLLALIEFTPILLVYPLLRFFLSHEFREYRKSGDKKDGE